MEDELINFNERAPEGGDSSAAACIENILIDKAIK